MLNECDAAAEAIAHCLSHVCRHKVTISCTKQDGGSNVQPYACSKSVTFDDIVGNDFAKQSLYENVVLPFQLPLEIRRHVLHGIRRCHGNVLLYGPPGALA